MHVLGRMGRLLMLLAAIAAAVAALPASTGAQNAQSQCSDGIDNDSDNAADLGDSGCADADDDDESDSSFSGIRVTTRALPVVTLSGTVDSQGALDVSNVFVRGDRGTVIDIACSGRRCPFKRIQRTMITTSLRIEKAERKLRPPMVVRMRLQRSDQLGKYVRYTLRRGQPPQRVDSCIDETTQKVRGCFSDSGSSGPVSVQPQCSDRTDNDGDGKVDGADRGCGGGDDDDETDTLYPEVVVVTRALPVVTLQGTVDRRGALDVSKLLFRGNRGTLINISCTGARCPFATDLNRRMITTSLRLRKYERRLRPPVVLKMRLQRSGELGKYVKYTLRRNRPPKRVDSCLDETTRKVRGCFTG